MAGLHAALSAIQTLRPGRATLQLGFPYVDVLKQPQVIFHGGELLQPPIRTRWKRPSIAWSQRR